MREELTSIKDRSFKHNRTMEGYIISYNSGHGVFAYTGNMNKPFYSDIKAHIFTDRKEARRTLKIIRAQYASNPRHYVARHFAIKSTSEDNDYIRNI